MALPEAPPYVALSYHWGDPNHTIDIEVNKSNLPVTLNLHAALLRLRKDGVDTVWVDALCINQKDGKEKSLQVPRMDAIFRKASQVAVWTGDDVDIDKPMARLLSTGSPPKLGKGTCLSTVPFFSNLLARPYWRRVWIVQELAVASKISVYCGRFRIPWQAIDAPCSCCRTSVNNGPRPPDGNILQFAMLRQLRINHLARKPISLLDALHLTVSSLATDPRDKVFALLGLTYDWKHFVPEPSYVVSTSDAFISFAALLISGNEPLDIIYLKSAKLRLDQALPSWVPDWNDLKDSVARRQFDYIIQRRSHLMHSGEPRGDVQADVCDRELRAKGIFFDVVDGLGTYLTTDDNDTFAHEISEANPLEMPYKQDDFPGIMCRTLGSTELFSYAPHSSRGNIHAGFDLPWELESVQQLVEAQTTDDAQKLSKAVFTWITEQRSFKLYGRTIESWTNTKGQLQDAKRLLPRELDCFNAVRSGMRFLVTKKGYVGWAHPQARTGDNIAIILGCSRPLILRACSGGHQIVGDACLSDLGILHKRLKEAECLPIRIK